MKIYLKVFILVIIIFSFSNFAYSLGKISKERQELSSLAPNFSLYDLDNNKINLSDYIGRNVILFFWTTWCPYCRQDLIRLERLYLGLRPKGIELLGINVGESRNIVPNFLKRYNISYPILLDSDERVAMLYELVGVPTYVIISPTGRIRFRGNHLPMNLLEKLKDE